MRRMLALILALVLLCGCSAMTPTHTNPSPIEGGRPVGKEGNLWYLPNEAVDSMQIRQLLGTEEGLLVCADGVLKLLSWEELSVRAEVELEVSGLAYVRVLEEGIGVADAGSGSVTRLDADLVPVGSVTGETGEALWLLSPDADSLYTLSAEELRLRDLEDGTDRELLRCRRLSVEALTGERIWLAMVPETDLMTHWYELELAGGTLTELADAPLIALQEGLRPQSNGAYLRVDGQTVTQYGVDGGFVSVCSVPDNLGIPGREFVWSEAWQGWFFLAYGKEGCRLLFWDPSRETTGEDIDIQPERIPEGELLPRELYDRAAELSARFDLDIRIAEQVSRDYNSYTAEVLTDPEVTAQALDVLEATLSVYPEGFFSELKYGDRHTVRIELVDALAPESNKDVSSGTSAFTTRRDRYSMLVLNARRIREAVIFHEFSHIIDKCLGWDAELREDALYSEEGWMALQPEGFAYADSYKNAPDSVKQFYDSGYFVRDYSCVSASEDRAMMLEKAMVGEQAVFDANPYLMPKLEYYCACIRDTFDDTDWPEVTCWEQLLP